MSIVVTGLDMPKNCAVCRLERDIFGRAVCFGFEDGRALHEDDFPPVGSEERRASWCPVEPKPRGEWGYRWKVHGDGRRPTELFPCSECGFENTQVTNFCPNCGADMRGDIKE